MKPLLLALMVLALSGCAAPSGITMTPTEASTCRAQGCTAWTESEIRALIGRVFREGYNRGAKDAGKGA